MFRLTNHANGKAWIAFLIILMNVAFVYGLENLTGSSASIDGLTIGLGEPIVKCGFSYIREAAPYEDKVYVLDANFPYLLIYSDNFTREREVNLERQLLRDLVISPEGEVYVLTSTGLWKIRFGHAAPFPDEVWDESYGVYMATYGDAIYGASRHLVSKFTGNGWMQRRYEEIDNAHDIAYVEPYVYIAGDSKLYVLDKNLSLVETTAFYNVSGISSYRGWLIGVEDSELLITNLSSNETARLELPFEGIKAYMEEDKLVLFNRTCIGIISLNITKPIVNGSNESNASLNGSLPYVNESNASSPAEEGKPREESSLMGEENAKTGVVALLLVILILLAFILRELRKIKSREKRKYKYRKHRRKRR